MLFLVSRRRRIRELSRSELGSYLPSTSEVWTMRCTSTVNCFFNTHASLHPGPASSESSIISTQNSTRHPQIQHRKTRAAQWATLHPQPPPDDVKSAPSHPTTSRTIPPQPPTPARRTSHEPRGSAHLSHPAHRSRHRRDTSYRCRERDPASPSVSLAGPV
jgi:hypothetical protein